MAEETNDSADVGIGFRVDRSQAIAAIEEVERAVNRVEKGLEGTVRKGKESNEQLERMGSVTGHLEEEFASLGSRIAGVFAIDRLTDFIAEMKRVQEELASEAGKEKQNYASAMLATGDALSPQLRKFFAKTFDDIVLDPDTQVVVDERKLAERYQRVRSTLPGPQGAVDTAAILKIATQQGQFMAPEQLDATIDMMVQRDHTTGSLGNPEEAYARAVRASQSGISGGEIESVMGAATGGATLAPGQSGAMFDAVTALSISLRKAGQSDRAVGAVLDGVQEARTKTVRDVRGRDVLAAPQFAQMLEDDPVNAVVQFASGGVPENEVDALVPSAAARRGLRAAQSSFRDVYDSIRSGGVVDTVGSAREVLGDQILVLQAERARQLTDEKNEGVALERAAHRSQVTSQVYNMFGGGVAGGIAGKTMGAIDFVTGGPDEEIGRMQRKAMGSDRAPAQRVDVNVTVRGSRDLAAQVDVVGGS